MTSPPDPTKIPGPSKARSTPRVDKIVDRIWSRRSPLKEPLNDNPVELIYLDSSNSTEKNTPEVVILESIPNEVSPTVELEHLVTNETEEREAGAPSSIWDIDPSDFYDPSEF